MSFYHRDLLRQFGHKRDEIDIPLSSSVERILHPYQYDMYGQILQADYSILESPMGSGKTTIISAAAGKLASEGQVSLVIISVPQLEIGTNYVLLTSEGEYAFLKSKGGKALSKLHRKQIVRLEGDELGGKHDRLVDTIRRARQVGNSILVCAHATLRRDIDKLDLKDTMVFVDESHHVVSEPGDENNLGKLIRKLRKNKIRHCLATATFYRGDGRVIVPTAELADYVRITRTLNQHFMEGYGPQVDVAVKCYTEITDAQMKERLDDTDAAITIGSYEDLVRCYAEDFAADEEPWPTLFVTPFKMRDNRMTGAELACRIEDALVKVGGSVMNLGGYKTPGGNYALVTASPTIRRSRFTELKIHPDEFNAVIAIRTFDEGMDWDRCAQVYEPHIPGSAQLIAQRSIGRCVRDKKHLAKLGIKHPSPDRSRVVFYETRVKQSSGDVRVGVMKLGLGVMAQFAGIDLGGTPLADFVELEREKFTPKSEARPDETFWHRVNGKLIEALAIGETNFDQIVGEVIAMAAREGVTIGPASIIERLLVMLDKELSSVQHRSVHAAIERGMNLTEILRHIPDGLKQDLIKRVRQVIRQRLTEFTSTVLSNESIDLMNDIIKNHWLYKTYEEAALAVRRAGCSTQNDYKSYREYDLRLPSNPNTYYPLSWCCWGCFLETGCRDRYYETYIEAKKAVQLICSKRAKYTAARQTDNRLHSAPSRQYAGIGWCCWGCFLRNECNKPFFKTLKEAANAAQSAGYSTAQIYRASQNRDIRLPASPHVVYSDDWCCWPCYLGKPCSNRFYSYTEAQTKLLNSGYVGIKRYRAIYTKDKSFPTHPPATYKTDWCCWGCYLRKCCSKSTVDKLSFDNATILMRSLNFVDSKAYKANYSKYPGLPSAPYEFYPDWCCWGCFLRGVCSKITHYQHLNEAAAAASVLGIRNSADYRVRKLYQKDARLPSDPERAYPDWCCWGCFAGNGHKSRRDTVGI